MFFLFNIQIYRGRECHFSFSFSFSERKKIWKKTKKNWLKSVVWLKKMVSKEKNLSKNLYRQENVGQKKKNWDDFDEKKFWKKKFSKENFRLLNNARSREMSRDVARMRVTNNCRLAGLNLNLILLSFLQFTNYL